MDATNRTRFLYFPPLWWGGEKGVWLQSESHLMGSSITYSGRCFSALLAGNFHDSSRVASWNVRSPSRNPDMNTIKSIPICNAISSIMYIYLILPLHVGLCNKNSTQGTTKSEWRGPLIWGNTLVEFSYYNWTAIILGEVKPRGRTRTYPTQNQHSTRSSTVLWRYT